MEKCSQSNEPAEAILAFDTLYTTNHLQMLKLLLPYLDVDQQHLLAIFIKWQEFQYTIRSHPGTSCTGALSMCGHLSSQQKELDLSKMLPLLQPYCSEEERKMLSSFAGIQSMMKTWKDISQYLPVLQEMMGAFSSMEDGASQPFAGTNGMMDLIQNMMTPEQQTMFSMFMEGGIP